MTMGEMSMSVVWIMPKAANAEGRGIVEGNGIAGVDDGVFREVDTREEADELAGTEE